MKQLIKNYSFNKTAKTVTFTDFSSIRLDRILLITDVTNNTLIYQFNNSQLGGTVGTNVLTLTYNTNTSAFNNTDALQIFYDSATGDPTYDAPSIGNVGACKLTKGGTVGEQVTCTSANTDYSMASAMAAGTKYLAIYSLSDILVAMGEASGPMTGVFVSGGVSTVFPVTVTGTTAYDKAHVQSQTAGAVVRFTSMGD